MRLLVLLTFVACLLSTLVGMYRMIRRKNKVAGLRGGPFVTVNRTIIVRPINRTMPVRYSHCLTWEIDVGDTTLYWLPSPNRHHDDYLANQAGCPHPEDTHWGDNHSMAWDLVTREVHVNGTRDCLCGGHKKAVWHRLGQNLSKIHPSVNFASRTCPGAETGVSGTGAYYHKHFQTRINTPPCQRELIEQMTHDVGQVFDDLGVWWVAQSGTLLGALRYSGMIPYDYDADITVDTSLTVKKWGEAMRRLTALGYKDFSSQPGNVVQSCSRKRAKPPPPPPSVGVTRGSIFGGGSPRTHQAAPLAPNDGQPRWQDKGWSQVRLGVAGRVVDFWSIEGQKPAFLCPQEQLLDDSYNRVSWNMWCTSVKHSPLFADPHRLIDRQRHSFGPNRSVWILPSDMLDDHLGCLFGLNSVSVLDRSEEFKCDKSKDDWPCTK